MTRDESASSIRSAYFDWLYSIVEDPNVFGKNSYRTLLSWLFWVSFAYDNDMDENRATHGLELREEYCDIFHVPFEELSSSVLPYCSVLEMMVALCIHIEDDIMSNPSHGDRTMRWFNDMLVSLGVDGMTDENFDSTFVANAIGNWLVKDYSSNGQGGLFTTKRTDVDMRSLDIWYQACVYINELLENEDGIYYGN